MSAGVKIFNGVRSNASQLFMDVVPSATEDNIQAISNVLFNDAYQPQLNEFVDTLINRVALTIVRNKSFNNPLAVLKKGSSPLGTDIQEIYTNPAEAEAYEYSNTAMAKLLTITDPDTKVAYYRRNRKDLYTKTILREGLQGAFTSWAKFEDFITSITQSLYSASYIDEFKYTKSLVDGIYDGGKAIVEVVAKPTDESSAKAFLKKARTIYNEMKFPSSDYNAYSVMSGDREKPVVTWTDSERVVLLVRADVLAEVDVEALASAFNIDRADFIGRVIPVDKFENEEILGVIADESMFQIYDNIFRFDSFYNARTMSWNYYLHAWQTLAVSPFANGVVLATQAPKSATAINLGADSFTIEGVGEQEGVEVTVTPSDATTEIEYESSNEEVFSIIKVDNKNITLTATGVGEAVLTAKSDNGLTDSATVTVTAGE